MSGARWGSGGRAAARRTLAVAGVLGALVLAGCAQDPGSGTGGGAGTLTVYSGQHVQTTEALVAAFERESGISVSLRSDDEDVLADQIVTDGSRSPADVFYTENSPPLQYLASKGLLAPVDPSTLANTPSRFNAPEGNWVGVSARVSVMVYNTSLLTAAELPKSVMELADPKWAGRIGLAGGETDFQPIVTSIARTYGEGEALRWLQAVKANAGGHAYPSNEAVTGAVNGGQVALGVINQYYWYRERAQVGPGGLHSAIATFAPHDVGYVMDVSGAGILRSSTHERSAQRFLAFLTSTQGQEILAHSDSFEYPIASGVTTVQPETPFDLLQPNSITVAELGTGAEAIKLLQEAQLL
jgi:iron(III) transport system substrate-binding protein